MESKINMCILMVVLYAASVTAMSIPRSSVDIKAFGVDISIPESCRKKWESFNESLMEGDKKNDPSHFYCTDKPENYPEGQFDSYIERTKLIKFPRQEIPLGFEEEDEHCRLDEEERNCCSKSSYEKFFFVESEKTLKLVVQTGIFEQPIRTTKCAKEGATCFKDFDPQGLGIQTSCRTDYGSIQMLVYNVRKSKLESVSVQIPVSCSCHLSLN